jgi:hypothetical protein
MHLNFMEEIYTLPLTEENSSRDQLKGVGVKRG